MFRSQAVPRSRGGAAVALSALLLTGCGQTIVDADVYATVRGKVVRQGGAPVAGAEVRPQILDATCTVPAEPATVVRTGEQGTYTFGIATFGASETQRCLRMQVVPPAGSGLAPITLADRPLILSPSGELLELDVEIPPAANG